MCAVLRVHTAAVLDSHLLRHRGADGLRDVLPDGLLRLLRLLRGGHLASADGPHRLVGDDDLGPVLDLGQAGPQLSLVHLRNREVGRLSRATPQAQNAQCPVQLDAIYKLNQIDVL